MRILLMGFLFALPTAEANQAPVTAVTLFKDRASVRRSQTIKLPPGATSIPFLGVTPLADVESIKAFASEKKLVRILGVRTEKKPQLKSTNVEGGKLEEEERSLIARLQELQEQAGVLSRNSDNLSRASRHYQESFALNLHENRWSKPMFQGFLKFLEGQGAKMHGSWKKIFEEYDKRQTRLELVQSRRRQLESVSDRETLTVFIDVVADEAKSVEASIQYLVGNAGWTPTYDLRIPPKGGKAVLEQHAMAWQRSGEDWESVVMTLSNLPNELMTEPPTLDPYTLSYRKVEQVKTAVGGKQEDKKEIGEGDTDPAPEEGRKGLAASFRIQHRQTLRQSGERTKIFVSRKEAPYQEELALVASQYPHAFRRGEMKNPFSWRLASGPMAIYYGGSYLQTTHLESVPKGGEIALNAGVDHHLKVKRELEDATGTRGLIQKDNKFTRHVRVSLENLSSIPKKVKVFEPIPVSEMEAVKVTWKDNTPKASRELASREDPKDGWLTWNLNVAPRKKETLKVELQVTVPKDFEFAW